MRYILHARKYHSSALRAYTLIYQSEAYYGDTLRIEIAADNFYK